MTIHGNRVPVLMDNPGPTCPPPKAWFVALLAGVGITAFGAVVAAKTSRR